MFTTVPVPAINPTKIFQDILGSSYSRRLLLQSPTPSPSPYIGDNKFDSNVVLVLSVLFCALVCSLGLNSIIRCASRCSSLVPSEEVSDNHSSVRLTNTGVERKALKCFQTVSYSSELNLPGLNSECAICLSEFVYDERVKLLPTCHHGFHVRCIDKWLSSHSTCPTCRHCLIETCEKIADCRQTSSLNSTRDGVRVQIAPLAPGRWICCFR